MATAAAPPQLASPARIATLDGWRGIAILLVLASHTLCVVGGSKHLPWALALGQHGVTLFFVISGFIITQRLLHEQEKTSAVSLRAFYIRRAFRILPCAWSYLALLSVIMIVAHHTLPSDLAAVLFFFRNFTDKMGRDVFTGHFWSLSLEEQFYLVWPAILVMLGTRRARWAAAIAALGIAAWRFHDRFALASLPLQATFATQFRADALLLGCVAAMAPGMLHRRLRIWMCLPLAGVVIACMVQTHFTIPFYESLSMAGLILTTTIFDEHRAVRAVLGFSPLVATGLVSYSLYIWQQFFIFGLLSSVGIPLAIGSAFLIAIASYAFMERPLIRAGRRLCARHQFTP